MACTDLSTVTANAVNDPTPASNMLSRLHPAGDLHGGSSKQLQGQVGWLVKCLTSHQAGPQSASTLIACPVTPAASQEACPTYASQQQLPQPSSRLPQPQQAAIQPMPALVDSACNHSNSAAQQQGGPCACPTAVLLSSRPADSSDADPALEPTVPVQGEPAVPDTGPVVAQPAPEVDSSPRSSATANADANGGAALHVQQGDTMSVHLVKPCTQPRLPEDIRVNSAQLELHPEEARNTPTCDNLPPADCSSVEVPVPDTGVLPLCALDKCPAQPAATSQAMLPDSTAADTFAHAGDLGPASSPQQACTLAAPDNAGTVDTADGSLWDSPPQCTPSVHALPVQENIAIMQASVNSQLPNSQEQGSSAATAEAELATEQLEAHEPAASQMARDASAVPQSATAQPESSGPMKAGRNGAGTTLATPLQALSEAGRASLPTTPFPSIPAQEPLGSANLRTRTTATVTEPPPKSDKKGPTTAQRKAKQGAAKHGSKGVPGFHKHYLQKAIIRGVMYRVGDAAYVAMQVRCKRAR